MSKLVPFSATLHVRDHCLCLHVQRAARALARRFDEALRPAGLTNQQFSLLMALNRPEPPTLGAVARLLGADRTTLTAALKPLVARGLTIVEAGKADKRERLLRLTAEGDAQLALALPIWTRVHAEVDATLADGPGMRHDLATLAGQTRDTSVTCALDQETPAS